MKYDRIVIYALLVLFSEINFCVRNFMNCFVSSLNFPRRLIFGIFNFFLTNFMIFKFLLIELTIFVDFPDFGIPLRFFLRSSLRKSKQILRKFKTEKLKKNSQLFSETFQITFFLQNEV